MIPDQGIEPVYDHKAAVRGVLTAVLAVLPLFLTSALAVQIANDLDFGASVLGSIIAAFYLTSAAGSFVMGHVVQILGPSRSSLVSTSVSALALALAAFVQSGLQLGLVLALAGAANAIAHPAANMLLSESISVRRLGLAFGIKQSSVPAAALLGGLAVPLVGIALGWRWAYVLACLAAMTFVVRVLVSRTDDPGRQARPRGSLRDSEAPLSSLAFLAFGGFLAAVAATALSTFFVDASVVTGYDPAVAGWFYALLSVLTIGSRVGFGWYLDRSPARSRFVLIASLLGVGSAGYLLLSTGNVALFALGALIAFVLGWGWVGALHYTVVTWFRRAPAAATGIASTGLNLGSGAGPLCFGFMVEHLGYATSWRAAGAVSLSAGATILAVRRHLRTRRRPSA